jgi:hypothetical protein
MASTYSTLKFELIGTGEQSGTWGNTTNTNLGTAIQEAITGSADVTFASGTVTLTLTDTNATQTARNLRLNLTGTSGGAQNLIVPAIEKFYLVNNGVADAITVKNSTGTGIAVPTGKAMLLFNNGTNVVDAVTHMSSLTLTTALAIAQGGTGATTADTALDNLGGTTVGKGVFKAATAAAAQQAMDTEVGVDVQAYDADLTALGGLAKTDGNIIVGNGTTWVAESGATARTSLGLGSIATQDSSAVTITGGSITGITDLAVADGGTGQGSYTDGQLLIGNTTGNTLTKATITAGTGISVTNGSGAITIAASGGGGLTNYVVLTSGTSYAFPASTTTAKVTVCGGGGGGGRGVTSNGTSGGHGGQGGAGIKFMTFPGGTTANYSIGAGGAGVPSVTNNFSTPNATSGGTTSFNAAATTVSATGGVGGGSGGTNSYWTKAGAPGAPSGHDWRVYPTIGSQNYTNGFTSASITGPDSDPHPIGFGWPGNTSKGANNFTANPGTGYGVGGGSGGAGNNNTGVPTGSGAAGRQGCIILEF